MRRIRSGCCARAENGHAAALPIDLMKSRLRMQVLFTTPAGLGHIHPTVPLARAMVERGHTVLWAVPPDGVEHVKEAGIHAVSAGVPGGARLSDFWTRYPEVKALPPADRPDVMFGKLFGAVAAPPMLADLAPVALDWRPDLIVADAAELAGPIVAAELGVPNVTKGFGPVLPETRVANAGGAVGAGEEAG